MCKNHVSKEESVKILKVAHRNHTYNCCPSFHDLTFADKVKSFDQIIGTFPVFNNSKHDIMNSLKNMTYRNGVEYSRSVRNVLKYMMDYASNDEFAKNAINKRDFDLLKECMEKQDELVREDRLSKPFQLIKKSSPKWSNLIMSILKHAGIAQPENHELMVKFNDRGQSKMDDYELVLSTEPHRIVGMSAFGKFTSCQDWIEKEDDHEYHSYTHQAWANAMDQTVGVLYIKEKDSDSPDSYDTDIQDMLARSLVRIAELPNGLKIVFLHRIYALNPYDKYLINSITEWEKTLPSDYRVIHMYRDTEKSKHDKGKNEHGIEFEGYVYHVHKQQECEVYGSNNSYCDTCNGEGHWECPECYGSGEYETDVKNDCDECGGSGYVWDNDEEEDVECDCCDGRGYFHDTEWVTCERCDGDRHVECNDCDGRGRYENDETYHPYNDHGQWMSLGHYNGIKFQIPMYLYNWTVEENKESVEDIA